MLAIHFGSRRQAFPHLPAAPELHALAREQLSSLHSPQPSASPHGSTALHAHTSPRPPVHVPPCSSCTWPRRGCVQQARTSLGGLDERAGDCGSQGGRAGEGGLWRLSSRAAPAGSQSFTTGTACCSVLRSTCGGGLLCGRDVGEWAGLDAGYFFPTIVGHLAHMCCLCALCLLTCLCAEPSLPPSGRA